MTPKEKAIELVNKYQSCEINFLEYAWVCPKGAKKLALIAVDEMINVLIHETYSTYKYWNEVKQEIEKL